MISFLFRTLQVERLAEKEKSLKAKRGWFGFLWSGSQTEEEQELNSAAAISNLFILLLDINKTFQFFYFTSHYS